MALFHKLFNTRKKCNTLCQQNDNVCENLFKFTTKQVRIVLFKECDYRGRKLLFDSQTIERIEISKLNENQKKTGPFAEINNGYGFKLHKPNSDTKMISEMIFGSVSMNHRGTSVKIHCLQSPHRMMYTQIFPCPRNNSRSQKSTSNTNSSGISTQSLDCSFACDQFSTCSSNSASDNSVNSAFSDTVLVCKRNHSESSPLDVPKSSLFLPTNLNSGEAADSGIDDFHNFQQSFLPDMSVPFHSIDIEKSDVSFSCGSLYKRYLRRTSTSLACSGNSLTTSASAEEYFPKSKVKSNNKLGIAIIIELTEGEELKMEKFLLVHAALLESMIWSARQMTEIAYVRNQSFFSIMNQLSQKIMNWLVNFLSGPFLSSNMWLGLSSAVCDNLYSIPTNSYSSNFNSEINILNNNNFTHNKKISDSNCDSSNEAKTRFKKNQPTRTFEFSVLNWTDFFSCDREKSNISLKDKALAKKFLNEFCEILEKIDVKNTKFFVSTLVTAILTHHLGWVATVLPASWEEREKITEGSSNALWGQLADLYGAVGHPTKMSHTIITGTNKDFLIGKLLNCLSYFIRCNDVEMKEIWRKDVNSENLNVDKICHEKSFIPKENYKKYKDHIKELEKSNEEFFKKLELKNIPKILPVTQHGNLLDKVTSLGIEILNFDNISKISPSDKFLSTSEAKEGFQKIFSQKFHLSVKNININSSSQNSSSDTLTSQPSVNSVNVISTNNKENSSSTLCSNELKSKSELSSSTLSKSSSLKRSKTKATLDISVLNNDGEWFKDESKCKDKEVVFVLGENEKLVGIKRELSKRNLKKLDEDYSKTTNDSLKNQFLNKTMEEDFQENSIFKDEDFIVNDVKYLKRSPSFLPVINENEKKLITRSQSVPPEDKQLNNNKCKEPITEKRFKYSGVKFNFHQFPKIVENYWRSKNIEMANLPFLKDSSTFLEDFKFDFTNHITGDDDDFEAYQTPSNASDLVSCQELSTTSKQRCGKFSDTNKILDTNTSSENFSQTKNSNTESIKEEANIPQFNKSNLSTLELQTKKNKKKEINSNEIRTDDNIEKMQKINSNFYDGNKRNEKTSQICLSGFDFIELPMPSSLILQQKQMSAKYTNSLIRGVSENYISNMVMQGTNAPKMEWESSLKQDLILCTRHPLLDQPIDEAVAIVANLDTWDVQLLSSHTYIVDKGSTGIKVGMSQLVSNMLESLLHLWKTQASPENCLKYIEQKLLEFCILSKALSQLLLATEFCSMEFLTSTLKLEVNDVPLLMAVASTHSPQLTEKYGLSFQ